MPVSSLVVSDVSFTVRCQANRHKTILIVNHQAEPRYRVPPSLRGRTLPDENKRHGIKQQLNNSTLRNQ